MIVFPANAGVSRRVRVLDILRDSIPRECGGEPKTAQIIRPSGTYSPRMRG